MIQGLKVDWHIVCPNLKKDVVDEGGKCIADPFLVLRGSIWTEEIKGVSEEDPEKVIVLTPPITGRLDRVKIGPVVDTGFPPYPPGPSGTFDMTIVQYDVDAWNSYTFDYPPASPYPGIDLLNGLGAGIPNDTVTEITEDKIVGARYSLIPMLLIEDRLVLDIEWGDGETSPPPSRLLNIYLYFRADKCIPGEYAR